MSVRKPVACLTMIPIRGECYPVVHLNVSHTSRISSQRLQPSSDSIVGTWDVYHLELD